MGDCNQKITHYKDFNLDNFIIKEEINFEKVFSLNNNKKIDLDENKNNLENNNKIFNKNLIQKKQLTKGIIKRNLGRLETTNHLSFPKAFIDF